jgi:ATP-dependent Clp protease ATP-binding subunit ClpB
VDDIIVFHPLSREHLTHIVDIQLERLRKRLADRDLKLTLSSEAQKQLADEGYDPLYGARPLKRVIQQRIENPLASRILEGEFAPGDTIVVEPDRASGNFRFRKAAAQTERAEA